MYSDTASQNQTALSYNAYPVGHNGQVYNLLKEKEQQP
jgi:hypothetical protein